MGREDGGAGYGYTKKSDVEMEAAERRGEVE